MRIQAEANLSALIESTEDMICSVDPRLRLITFNRAFVAHFERYFGGPVAPGMSLRELLPPERAVSWFPLIEQALKGQRFRSEITLIDGRILDFSFSPILVDGETTGVSVFGKDVTETKAAEKKYRDIFEGALEGFFQTTREGKLLTANRMLARMLGYDSPEEAIVSLTDSGHQLWVDAEERDRVMRQIEENRFIQDYECRFKRKDGGLIWVLLNCRCVRNNSGQLVLFEGSIQDVTERKRAEDTLKKTEANLSALVESTQDLIWSVDLDYRLITFNKALQQNIEKDYHVRLAQGMRFHEVLLPERAALWPQFYKRVLEEGPFRIEYIRIDGGWMELSFNPILVDGKAIGVSVFGKDITEQKRSEAAIKKADANLSALIESTQDLVWAVDLDYHLIVFNRKLVENIQNNFGAQIVTKRTECDFLPLERAKQWPPLYQRALAEGPYQTEYILADGHTLELSLNPVLVDGKAVGVSVFGKDITERLRAEKRLRDSEELYRATFDQVAFGIAHCSFDGVYLLSNHRFAEIIGYLPEEVPGLTVAQITASEDLAAHMEALQRVSGGEIAFATAERCYLRKDGSLVWARSTLSLQRDGAGNPLHFISFVEDIHDRKLAEAQLRESRDFLAEAQRIGDLGCYVLDFSIGLWTSTPQLDEVFGIDQNYVRSVDGWAELIHPDDRAMMTGYFNQEVFEAGKNFDKEYRILRASDGAERWVHGMGRLDFDAQGHPTKMRGTIRDITKHKQAELTVLASEKLYRAITENSPLAYVITSGEEDRIDYLNPAFVNLFGYTRDEIPTAAEFWQRAYPDAAYGNWVMAEWQRKIPRVFAPGSAREPIETVVACKNGAKKNVVWGFVKLGERNLAYGLDITEQKQATQALRESEARFRRFFEENGSVMLMLSPEDGEIVAANQAACEFYGYPKEQFVGMHTHQINNPSAEQLARDRQSTLDSACSFFTYKNRRSNGEERDVEVYSSPIEVNGRTLLYAIVHDVTDRKQAEHLLQDSEQLYRATFEQAPVGIVHAALDGRYLRCNQRFAEIIGYPQEEVAGLSLQQITVPEDLELSDEAQRQLQMDCSARVTTEKRYIRKDGSRVWVKVSVTPRCDSEGRVLYLIAIVEDIQARKNAEERLTESAEALKKSELRYRTAFQTSQDTITISQVESGEYVDVNETFLRRFGYEREEVIGRSSLELENWADSRDRELLIEILRQGSYCRCMEIQFKRRNGELFWGEISASLMEVDGVPCILAITRDISHEKMAESTIRNLAFYDSLTGLPNRRFLSEKLYQIQAIPRAGHSRALLFVELDHFKTLNETLGHQTGDLLLKEIARRINGCISESDIVCRVGGDEFAVLLEDLCESVEEAAAQAQDVGERIRASIGAPCLLDGRECITTASIGSTVFGAGPQSTDELMQEADIALYQAKLAGRNTLRFFSPALQSAVNARATLEEDLRQAIKGKQFRLYYQPQVERGVLIGAEALIRWLHPKKGMVLPDAFIPLAEETGLILPVGDLVLEAACHQIAAWAGRKITHLTVAVNISALQFRQQGFVETVLKALESSGANPKNLKLELTESMLVENIEDVIAKMTALKAHGLSFSLDDFGTGYSSLAYLKRLPLDQLKIDRAFVRDMLVDVTSGAIAQTIISLGRAMGLSVIAEGVETEEQRGFLAGLGCHAFQGMLFSPPLPLEAFEAFI